VSLTEEIQSSWGWVGIEVAHVVGENDFGNLMIEDTSGKYWRLCPEDGWCEIVANTREVVRAGLIGDARHDVWIIGVNSKNQIVYDEHNLLYAYGADSECEAFLNAKNMAYASISIPAPHSHNFHAELDQFEDEVLEYWEWVKFPLEPSDEV